MNISSKDIRNRFLMFFEKNNHQIVKSSPLLPTDDPSLLFINAGMAQFKDVFTGLKKRSCKNACSSQKCIRAGGKHNDLKNVGYTARHQVFFEMLGNFSFGNYFKKKACIYAWNFLTKELKLDPNKLTVSVFGGEDSLPADKETEIIWRDIVGVNPSKIFHKGAFDNFWSMGDTGPCGPCSEIYYNKNEKAIFGNNDDKKMEIWNLVFMEYERKKNGSLISLPTPCIDTGMGLERICSIVNNFTSNYETDLLKPYIDYMSKYSNKLYNNSSSEDDVSFRVIADHCRAVSFIIADGILPSNEGRGYVLRRIMRRAIRHTAKLTSDKLFFYKLCIQVVKNMCEFYPELHEASSLIKKVVMKEEDDFRKTLDRGFQLFNKKTKKLKVGDIIDGLTVFKLYETYGFHPDLTSTLAKEKKIQINWDEFNKAKINHEKISSGTLGLKKNNNIFKELNEHLDPTIFLNNQKKYENAKIITLLKNNKKVKNLQIKDEGIVLLDKTIFYGESGGQIGDSGFFSNKQCQIEVFNTKKILDLYWHYVKVIDGNIRIGDQLSCEINNKKHQLIKQHHSVTHLLHAALRKILGSHVIQKGSMINEKYMRFDFSHFKPLKIKEIYAIEDLINNWILESSNSNISYMTFNKAKECNAIALFGEKYKNKVRVINMGPNSIELCGGSHVENTGNIGQFKIISESSLSSGIRRIEGVAGINALQNSRNENQILKKLTTLLSTSPKMIIKKTENILNEIKIMKQKSNFYKNKKIINKAQDASKNTKVIAGIKVFIQKIESNFDQIFITNYAKELQKILGSSIVILGSVINNKAIILITLSKDLTKKLHAGKLINKLANIIGGKGGGKANFAQAGGPKHHKLNEALKTVEKLITSMKLSN